MAQNINRFGFEYNPESGLEIGRHNPADNDYFAVQSAVPPQPIPQSNFETANLATRGRTDTRTNTQSDMNRSVEQGRITRVEPGVPTTPEEWRERTGRVDWRDPNVRENWINQILSPPKQLDDSTLKRRANAQAINDIMRLVGQGIVGSRGANIQPMENRIEPLVERAYMYRHKNKMAQQQHAQQQGQLRQALDQKAEAQARHFDMYAQGVRSTGRTTIQDTTTLTNENRNQNQHRIHVSDLQREAFVPGQGTDRNFAGYYLGNGEWNVLPRHEAGGFLQALLDNIPAMRQHFHTILQNITTPDGRLQADARIGRDDMNMMFQFALDNNIAEFNRQADRFGLYQSRGNFRRTSDEILPPNQSGTTRM